MRILTDRETNTLLHALRSVAINQRDDIRDACTLEGACDHFEIQEPILTSGEIDELCDTINLGGVCIEGGIGR